MKTKNRPLNFGIACALIFCGLSSGSLFGQELASGNDQEKSKTAFEDMKAEWEQVREQQIQMIREKEEQLEKLKDEIFAKAKTFHEPASSHPPGDKAADLSSGQSLQAQSARAEPQDSGLARREAALAKRELELKELEARLEQRKQDLDAREASLKGSVPLAVPAIQKPQDEQNTSEEVKDEKNGSAAS